MNIDLPKLKVKLPRDLSRRDILSLVGVAIVLVAIPLTVILFRRYQETRIKALDSAQIVDGTVKITNIHAHGFTVSWATVGESKGYIVWGPPGPPEQALIQRAYDDRAGATGADYTSSTHHVTLPHPQGSDEPLGLFEEPNQPFHFKIHTGTGGLDTVYGIDDPETGGFDGYFDVDGVVSEGPGSTFPIRVTTGPELAPGCP